MEDCRSAYALIVFSLKHITFFHQVADDALGKGILEELEADGVDTSFFVVCLIICVHPMYVCLYLFSICVTNIVMIYRYEDSESCFSIHFFSKISIQPRH